MLTTSRSTDVYTREQARSSLGLLEREPVAYDKYAAIEEVSTEKPASDRERMSKNFDMLLNYEKYAESAKIEEEQEIAREQAAQAAEKFAESQAVKADLFPSATTMQFEEADVQSFYDDLKQEDAKTSYKLNVKGKAMLAFYVLAVVAIIALIILNTTVLASLRSSNVAYEQEYASLLTETQQLTVEKESLETVESISQRAEELGMIK